MKILIIGGHGKVALLLAPLLVSRGDDVTSLIRNPEHSAEVAEAGAEPLVLDVESADPSALHNALSGFDAVVWSAGAGGGNPARTWSVDRDAAVRTVDAAVAAGVRRFVMVSWLGSTPDHGVSPDDPFYAYAEAKLAADDHLRSTGLDWTILGPGTLTLDPPTGAIAPEPEGDGTVSRADVAAVVVAALEDDRSVGRFLRFGAGDVPIAEAFAD